MIRCYKVALLALPLFACSLFSSAQNTTRSRTAVVVTNPIPTNPANLSQFQVEGALITQNNYPAPIAAANVTGNFGNTARWNSMGNLNAGTQTLNGFRTQTNGRALVSGHSINNTTGVLSNAFIQWIGNSTVGVTPGALEFKFALNPGGVGAPANDVTLFTLAPIASGVSGDAYAQNGILGHLQNGTFGDISGASQWLGHGPARIAGALDATIYGNRIQQGAQSMLFNLVNGKPVVGWGDQGQDMVFRYFPNRFNSALFTDVLTLQSNGRSNFGPAFSTTSKVSIRGEEANGLEIVVKTNPIAVQVGGDAVVTTATQSATGFYGRAQSDGTNVAADVAIRNYGVRGQAGVTGSPVTLFNFGVYGEANPNSSGSTNYGVYGICPPSSVATFTAGGYFVGGLYADGVIVMSDQQLKKNVQTESNITDRIMQLRPVTYQMDMNRKGYSFSNKMQHGFIAQEMEKVFPELVTDIKHPVMEEGKTRYEDIKGVNYVGLVSVLTRGMQEQLQQMTTQENRIAALEEEIKMLKQAIAAQDNATPAKAAAGNVTPAGYSLKQNVPNPFSESAIISFTVPATEKNASLAIFDLNGRMITQYSNLAGKTQVTVNANELQPGIYLYSLLAGGQEILTKRMVITQ